MCPRRGGPRIGGPTIAWAGVQMPSDVGTTECLRSVRGCREQHRHSGISGQACCRELRRHASGTESATRTGNDSVEILGTVDLGNQCGIALSGIAVVQAVHIRQQDQRVAPTR